MFQVLFLSGQSIVNYHQYNFSENTLHAYFQTDFYGNSIVYWGSSENNLSNMVVYQNDDDIHHNVGITGLTPATVYYLQFASVNTIDINDTTYSEVIPMMTNSQSSGDIKVYFNKPVDHSVASSPSNQAIYLNNTFPDTIKAYLDRAKESIDITIYNIDNDNGLITAINDAYNRGVDVRVVGDKDISTAKWNSITVGSNKIQSPDGQTPSGEYYSLMHNKFIVIDANTSNPNDAIVITGSTNFTDGQLNDDPNNLIILQDQSLAKAYTLAFEEMFNGTFGPEKSKKFPEVFELNGKRVEAYFSPTSGMEDILIHRIYRTAYDLHFGVFAYTRWSVSNAIEESLNTRSIFASGILDQVNTSNSEYTILDNVMSSTLFVNNQSSLFHHKYALFDANCTHSESIIWTGSANWSNNGFNKSDENVVLVFDYDIANQYYQEYIQRYQDNGGTVMVSGNCDESVLNIEEEVINEDNDILKVKVYPNPNNGNFTISSSSSQVLSFSVFDVSGREVISENQLLPFSMLEINKNLDSGNYFLIFRGESDGVSEVKKLVVR